MARVMVPIPDLDDQYFWEGVAQRKLLARGCAECGRLQQPPSPMCPRCGSVDWTVRELSGRGTVYTWIVSRHPAQPEGEARLVAVVELVEGVRLVSNLYEVSTADVRNGLPVEVTFREVGEVLLPGFRPAADGVA
ncbi:Zn-ribbon domain-containing OB-fold protein [Streptomyces sp. NPDC091292]|uniref:Zn-ribbon domain-containing OB-fold protein n=1 Tax=Streptomyces sp. NPDC091292 TaxID=3365991 RepID=UPI0037FBED1A